MARGIANDPIIRERQLAALGKARAAGTIAKRQRVDERLLGKLVGRLTILRRLVGRQGRTRYECLCECGRKVEREAHNLRGQYLHACSGGCRIRLPFGEAAKRAALRDYRCAAAAHKLPFDLTDDAALTLMQQPCFYCGAPPSNSVSRSHKRLNGDFIYSGLDRLDNKLGYVSANVVPCCWVCNERKSDADWREFVEWADRVGRRFNESTRNES